MEVFSTAFLNEIASARKLNDQDKIQRLYELAHNHLFSLLSTSLETENAVTKSPESPVSASVSASTNAKMLPHAVSLETFDVTYDVKESVEATDDATCLKKGNDERFPTNEAVTGSCDPSDFLKAPLSSVRREQGFISSKVQPDSYEKGISIWMELLKNPNSPAQEILAGHQNSAQWKQQGHLKNIILASIYKALTVDPVIGKFLVEAENLAKNISNYDVFQTLREFVTKADKLKSRFRDMERIFDICDKNFDKLAKKQRKGEKRERSTFPFTDKDAGVLESIRGKRSPTARQTFKFFVYGDEQRCNTAAQHAQLRGGIPLFRFGGSFYGIFFPQSHREDADVRRLLEECGSIGRMSYGKMDPVGQL